MTASPRWCRSTTRSKTVSAVSGRIWPAGVELRHGWGTQYRSHHFTGSLAWLGITDSPAYPGEPECNGCAERWIKTLKEQCLWARSYRDIDELRQAVAAFVTLYNDQWLIERLGHRTPNETYQQWLATREQAA